MQTLAPLCNAAESLQPSCLAFNKAVGSWQEIFALRIVEECLLMTSLVKWYITPKMVLYSIIYDTLCNTLQNPSPCRRQRRQEPQNAVEWALLLRAFQNLVLAEHE